MKFKIIYVSAKKLVLVPLIIMIAVAIFFYLDFYKQSKSFKEKLEQSYLPTTSQSDTYRDLFKDDSNLESNFTFVKKESFPVVNFWLNKPDFYLVVTRNELADTNINLSKMIKIQFSQEINEPDAKMSKVALDFERSVFGSNSAHSKINLVSLFTNSSDIKLLHSSDSVIEYSGNIDYLNLIDENSKQLLYSVPIGRARDLHLNILFFKKNKDLYTILKYPVSNNKSSSDIFNLLNMR